MTHGVSSQAEVLLEETGTATLTGRSPLVEEDLRHSCSSLLRLDITRPAEK